ncbi:MAG: GNAT family N-acetyltransferase [Bacteroidetes bacterium]|nr:GNAT family N-acetyltransferase [Bacteroidota bacterium]
METKIDIRKYATSDYDEILKLLRLNTPGFFALSEEVDLIDFLNHHIEYYYVVEVENEIVACGGFNFSGDFSVGKISWDIINPDFQGRGIGSLLLRYRIEKLKEFGHVKTISVRTSQLVYKFYEKNGFRLTEIIKDYWADGFDLYNMEYDGR